MQLGSCRRDAPGRDGKSAPAAGAPFGRSSAMDRPDRRRVDAAGIIDSSGAAVHGLTAHEEDALRMLTIEGARALGLDAEIGSLEVGKQADLAVFPSTVFSRPLPTSTALLTIVAGRVVRGYIPAQ